MRKINQIIEFLSKTKSVLKKEEKTYPNIDPKKDFDDFNFFSASSINWIAFCSWSAIVYVLSVLYYSKIV